ncbi:MAG TPA: permease prefix domain 1-containing protein [Bryobacteraceae bacterium]|jgi:putative ABC transport system permease protein
MKRILRYFRSRQFDRDLDDEIEAHLEEKMAELQAEGVPEKEARERALRLFGNRRRAAESSREQLTFGGLEEIAQDLRYTMRVLRRSPMFATVAIATLALGIGANAIIFSVVDHVLLSSLPYPQSSRLIAVSGRSAAQGALPMQVSAADFYDLRDQSDAFESLSAYSNWPMNLTNVDEPRRLDTQLVSANLFSTLGVQAQLGRTFLLRRG